MIKTDIVIICYPTNTLFLIFSFNFLFFLFLNPSILVDDIAVGGKGRLRGRKQIRGAKRV